MDFRFHTETVKETSMKKYLAPLFILFAVSAWATFPGSPIGGGSSGGDGNATSITDNLIVNADVNSAANIDGSKLADNTIGSGKIKIDSNLGYLRLINAGSRAQLEHRLTADDSLISRVALYDDGEVWISSSPGSASISLSPAGASVLTVVADNITLGAISNTELSYLDNVTSGIQAQLNGKYTLADNTIGAGEIKFSHDLGYSKFDGATQVQLRYYLTSGGNLGYLRLGDDGQADLTGTDNAGSVQGWLKLGTAHSGPGAYLFANSGLQVKIEGDNVVIVGQLQSDNVAITGGSVTGITDITVADGGTGRSTGTTAYALVATGTTATGAQQTLASGADTEVLVGGGASALPVWTTATGTGAPVRAGSPTLTGTLTVPKVIIAGTLGGTIDNTVIGGTTPAAGSFTTVTGSEFISTAADNTRGVTIPNTADPTGANLAPGKGWWNNTSNMLKWSGSDNVVREVFTSGATHTLSFATTGTLTGGIMILDNVVSPTAAQCYGSWNTIAGAQTVTLPAVAAGMSTCIATTAAAEITLELDNSDTFVLAGVTMTAGEAIINTTAEAAGDYICVIGITDVIWRVAGKQGTWTQATP